MKLRGVKAEKHVFYKKLPSNADKNSFDGKLNDNNYKRTFKKLHDDGWENNAFISDGVDMIDHGCGLSQYPQFYDQQLENY